jgi:hypothetical protein
LAATLNGLPGWTDIFLAVSLIFTSLQFLNMTSRTDLAGNFNDGTDGMRGTSGGCAPAVGANANTARRSDKRIDAVFMMGSPGVKNAIVEVARLPESASTCQSERAGER